MICFRKWAPSRNSIVSVFTCVRSTRPRFAVVEVNHAPWRAPRVAQNATRSVKRITIAVVASVEVDLQVGIAHVGYCNCEIGDVRPALCK